MMNFELTEKLKNLDFNVITLAVGIYLIAIGVAYYFIFREHHKRNKVEMDELISLVTKFYTLTMFSTLMLVLGVFCIIKANSFKDSRTDVIIGVLTGIIIITITIYNFILYIKKNLKDFVQEVREGNKKRTIKIGEILELIFFIIFLTMPIWRIPVFIETFDNTREFIQEILRAIGLSIASLFLLIYLNPLCIKEKVKNIFKCKEKKIK